MGDRRIPSEDLTDTVARVAVQLLQSSGYTVTSRLDRPGLVFEDASLIGFVETQSDAETVLAEWQAAERAFLDAYRERLLSAGPKAWNIYSVFLVSAPCSDSIARRLWAIEENLQNTRKLTRTLFRDTESIRRALYPLLPVQTVARETTTDVFARLRERLSSELSPDTLEAFLAGEQPDRLFLLDGPDAGGDDVQD